ncbi:hypothetical protein CB1_000212002 [Camelus ferus]|nr:hypothetical protein CB1_000212002 [Camelus ferus]
MRFCPPADSRTRASWGWGPFAWDQPLTQNLRSRPLPPSPRTEQKRSRAVCCVSPGVQVYTVREEGGKMEEGVAIQRCGGITREGRAWRGLRGTNVSYLKTKKTSQPAMEVEEESAERIQFLKSSGTSILSIDSLEANEYYSDDFEDEEDLDAPLAPKEETNSKENSKSEKINVPKQEEEKTGMLANVVLLDSLDSVAEVNLDEQDKATTKPKALPDVTDNEMTGTGVSYGQSSSDIEALRQAYCHVAHSLEDADEQRTESDAGGNTKSSVKDHLQENEGSSKNISTTESDLPTVEELMKPIRIDAFEVGDFDLQPVRERGVATPEKSEGPAETDSCVQFPKDSSGYGGGNKEAELTMFERVQEAEGRWRGAQALIEQIKVTFAEKERELENQMEELKRQQEKELFKLNQDNYILQAKKEKTSLLEDLKRLKQDKQALEVDVEKMKKERDQAKEQIAYVTGEKLYEIKILEETHKQEISRLQKRLQWYAENQELLDKDAVRLKEANEEIEKLKLEVEKLKAESGNPSIQQKIRLKEKAADAKKIQDLERQVKEMEGILKRRYPNSLPALILAASAAGDTVDRNTVEFMEKRVKKLEADLEGRDEEAKKSLRTMEQQFQKMKIQYEQRLEEQEQLLACKLKEAAQNQHDNSSRVQALEKELDDIKEAHQITVRNLEAEIDALKHQNAELERKKNAKDGKDFQSIEFQVEQAHSKAKLARLNEELAAKGREIQDLSKTVERLQRERRTMLCNQNSKGREEITAKRVKRDALHPEVLQENCRLKNELERLIEERNELKMKSDVAVSQYENSMKRFKEDTAAHITSLKASHQREVEKLLCQNAVENSSSKVAELNRKIATQEITKLLEELREAKENHTPEMKHFMVLEKKIKQMEMRHEQREQELQQIIQQTHQVVETEQNKEIEKWKRLAQLKNRELDKFRTELDSILDVLRELQRQGVVVPVALADEVNAREHC